MSDYIVYCHHEDHRGFGKKWSDSAGHLKSTSTLIGSPEYGALWHCPEHKDCPTCPRGSWSDPSVDKE